MNRREYLRTGLVAAGATTVAGCSSLLKTEPIGAAPPVLEDRPDAVYVPTHVEGMKMVDTAETGRYTFALTYSFPHRFWIVTGQDRERVDIGDNDAMHLMLSVWDTETGTVVPNGDLRVTVTRDGEPVTSKSLWPMLSQNMGLHFGDNVSLSGEGTYEVEASIGPMSTRRTGQFQGAFGEPASVSFSLEFSREALEEISYERLDRAGERDAVEPMGMEMMPNGQLPEPGQLPGRVLSTQTSGDGRFVVTALEEPPAGIDAAGTYLAVSARTPYNRYPLPFMSLSARLERDGDVLFDDDCVATFDPALNYHYGAAVDAVESGDTLRLAVGAPPQIARHEGYETAFFEMDDMELTV
jgi:hypothetical protein